MKLRNTGCTQIIAAAKTGISERTGRRIETGECNANQSPRNWRTRKDPLDPIWACCKYCLLITKERIEDVD